LFLGSIKYSLKIPSVACRNSLKFVEHHQPFLSIDAFKRRRGLPAGDWRLQRVRNVEYESVQKDRSAITECEPLKSLWLRRDKFHAHFDKHYFFDRARIVKEVLSNGLTLIMRWNF
jgi:hypothetical protein